ncbi:hypothetical protein [Agrococcus sp. BE272]|uniref:hypothetical protein n=1 Tax=Agrococcus sp. BE272 TaxID=2817727 RepID=UPI002855E09E|nr:hypothetical protein [Agrococcus sp. BE272]MDR7234183.1 hypothetical protein [Agrococcus sp. BE272]
MGQPPLQPHSARYRTPHAPSFSVWATIEECLNPPVIWERSRTGVDGGWYTTPPFSEPRRRRRSTR